MSAPVEDLSAVFGNPTANPSVGILRLVRDPPTDNLVLALWPLPLECGPAMVVTAFADVITDGGISHIRVIFASDLDSFILLIHASSPAITDRILKTFVGSPFPNSAGPPLCGRFVLSATIHSPDAPSAPLSPTSHLPPLSLCTPPHPSDVCPVCLDPLLCPRVPITTSGLPLSRPPSPTALTRPPTSTPFTTACDHTYHCECLAPWDDAPCPVCRFAASVVASRTCDACGRTAKPVVVCLVCGARGCVSDRAVVAAASAAAAFDNSCRAASAAVASTEAALRDLTHRLKVLSSEGSKGVTRPASLLWDGGGVVRRSHTPTKGGGERGSGSGARASSVPTGFVRDTRLCRGRDGTPCITTVHLERGTGRVGSDTGSPDSSRSPQRGRGVSPTAVFGGGSEGRLCGGRVTVPRGGHAMAHAESSGHAFAVEVGSGVAVDLITKRPVERLVWAEVGGVLRSERKVVEVQHEGGDADSDFEGSDAAAAFLESQLAAQDAHIAAQCAVASTTREVEAVAASAELDAASAAASAAAARRMAGQAAVAAARQRLSDAEAKLTAAMARAKRCRGIAGTMIARAATADAEAEKVRAASAAAQRVLQAEADALDVKLSAVMLDMEGK